MNRSIVVIRKSIGHEYLILIVTLIIFTFFLTPVGFEPGGESWGAWAAARILAETGGFPVFSRNPLYVAYLTLFLKTPFPTSLILEYWILHLFALTTIYALLRACLGTAKSLVLTTVLIPFIGIVEGGGTVAAIGFFSLYLRNYATTKVDTWIFLPATLLAAALCHSVYLPFLILHLLVSGFLIFREKSRDARIIVNYGRLHDKVLLALLVGFTITVFLFQSARVDNNHMLMDTRFVPIPLSSAINIGFFQIKTWALVEKAFDPSILVFKDWYFETPKFFNNSKTIFEVLTNNSELFFSIFFKDIHVAALIPLNLYSFYFPPSSTNITIAASLLVFLLLLVGMVRFYQSHGVALLFILSVGSFSVVSALLLTWFSFRYLVTLLPIFLLLYSHYLGYKKHTAEVSIYENSSLKNGIFIFGCALVLSNAPFVANNERIESECTTVSNPSVLSKGYQISCKKWKRIQYQIGDVIYHKGFLNNQNSGFSMLIAYPVLSKLIDNKARILSLENTFLSSFTDVDINNNRQIWSLPPYEDKSDYTNNFLNETDVIFVSKNWAKDTASTSTQSYLRYKLHILPYLSARKLEFDVVQVSSYGNAYIRKNRVQLSSTTSINRD